MLNETVTKSASTRDNSPLANRPEWISLGDLQAVGDEPVLSRQQVVRISRMSSCSQVMQTLSSPRSAAIGQQLLLEQDIVHDEQRDICRDSHTPLLGHKLDSPLRSGVIPKMIRSVLLPSSMILRRSCSSGMSRTSSIRHKPYIRMIAVCVVSSNGSRHPFRVRQDRS